MSDLTVMAGLPVSVEVGDETYLVSPMMLNDWAELERWARERFYADMEKRMEVNDEIKKIVESRLATMSYTEVMFEANAYQDDAEGTTYRLFLMLKQKHPDMTKEKAGTLVGIREFNQAQRLLLGMTKEPTKKEEEEAKKEEAENKGRPTGS